MKKLSTLTYEFAEGCLSKNNKIDKLIGASERIKLQLNGASRSCLSVLFLMNFNFGT